MTEPEKWQPEFGPPAKEVVCMQPVPLTDAKGLPGQLLANIDHLPNELLMQIFQLYTHASIIAFPSCDVHCHLKRQLVSVSQCWKDIILNSADFWTTIKLTPTWSKSFIKVHLVRSSKSFLSIEMCSWWPSNAFVSFIMHSLLDLLIPCSHHWHSIVIRQSAPHAQLIQLLSTMKDKMFPSHSHFPIEYIDGWLCNSWMAPQLCTENFPQLQHLELGEPFNPSNLALLALRLDDWGPSCIIQHPSLQKLTSLTLSGHAKALQLDPSSIQMSLLKKFTCKARDGYILVHAIVAPNLVHLKYSSGEWIGLADDQ